ncbi:MAG: ATP synthase F1 subunit gamma [Muribaculaceae bacterium]|nr:ATP synthase F1 subunit gamma [Muribaculaceae bacterium]
MATLRDLKGRIGSVSSSEKITGAMKMISSAKMNKAVRDIKRLLPFRNQLESIIAHLLEADAQCVSPLTEEREVRHLTIVVTGSDDGLCGAYNINIYKELLVHLNSLREEFPSAIIRLIPVGAKMVKAVAKLADAGIEVVTDAPVSSKSDPDAIKTFTLGLEREFLDGSTDRVDFVYMGFISPSRQRVRCEQLLPVANATGTDSGSMAGGRPYLFEPDAGAIFAEALPLMLLSSVQEGFSENRASEQAARVMAMQSANDNASKLLEQLRLEYNKLRQQSITNELLDILGGQVR